MSWQGPTRWQGKGVLILGATSAIAEATAREFAAQGARVALVARDTGMLAAMADDLKVRGAPAVTTRGLDLVATEPTQDLIKTMADDLGGLDAILLAYGTLGDQVAAETSLTEAASILDTNFTSAALWTLAGAEYLKTTRGSDGVVAALCSVAGDRGRASNFVYGAAKGGLATLLQGLSHRRAHRGGPRAVAFKLGFVITPMTAGFKRSGPLWATPSAIAKVVVRGMASDQAIVYGPWFWRFVMLIIRLLPQPLMDKVNL